MRSRRFALQLETMEDRIALSTATAAVSATVDVSSITIPSETISTSGGGSTSVGGLATVADSGSASVTTPSVTIPGVSVTTSANGSVS